MIYRCKKCKTSLPSNHTGNCPNCGNKEKEIVAVINETLEIKESVIKKRTFFENHPYIKRLNIVAILLSSVSLFYFYVGIVSCVLGVVCFILGERYPCKETHHDG